MSFFTREIVVRASRLELSVSGNASISASFPLRQAGGAAAPAIPSVCSSFSTTVCSCSGEAFSARTTKRLDHARR